MKYPNLRYGNPTEFRYYAMGIPLDQLARMLRRDQRTVRDWLTERRKLPWWVPELLRLRQMETYSQVRHMGIHQELAKFAIVNDTVVELPIRQRPGVKTRPASTWQHRDDSEDADPVP